MNPLTSNSPPTFESVWAALQETDRQRKENERFLTEKQAETDRQMKETDRQMKETDKKIARLEQSIDKTNKQIGGITNSNGGFCEEYFTNAYKRNPFFLGQKFNTVHKHLKPDPAVIDDEYDLVLQNENTIVIIEIKYKAGSDDLGSLFSKLVSYRANYPMYKNYKIYLCLASFNFHPIVREVAEEAGIVLIEQRGGKIEVISEMAKTW